MNTFQDGNGLLHTGTDREIVLSLRGIEWGDCPPVLEWKDRVRMRASWFGFALEFHDASSFLDALERAGLGQRIPTNSHSKQENEKKA